MDAFILATDGHVPQSLSDLFREVSIKVVLDISLLGFLELILRYTVCYSSLSYNH